MTESIDFDLGPELRHALRAEAYRPPVGLTPTALTERAQASDQRRRSQLSWYGLLAATVGLALVVAVGAVIPGLQSPLGGPATPGSSPCPESEAVTHGSWWVEMGGPHAFFNIEPGTRTATSSRATWLLYVRFDPDAGRGESVSIGADRLTSGEHVDGRLNSPADPANIYSLDLPAPPLPGGWYLFELDVHAAGCWKLSARINDRAVGAAIVDVGPAGPSATDRPGTPDPPTPTIARSQGGAAALSERARRVGYVLRRQRRLRAAARQSDRDQPHRRLTSLVVIGLPPRIEGRGPRDPRPSRSAGDGADQAASARSGSRIQSRTGCRSSRYE